MHWHYSKRMPMPPLVRVGVWESGKFIGCVLFGRGASPQLGTPYGLTQLECCELVRIALTKHVTPVSRIVKLAIKLLRENSPGLRLIVSFADANQGHHGGIYQAGNWLYLGKSAASVEYFHEGRWKHQREVSGGAFGGERKIADPSGLPKRRTEGKHRYVMPLDDRMRERLASHAQQYPKPPLREKQAMAGSTGTAAV
ncbi:protein Mom [Burkholderia reimsis]|uniref:Protein Mom n=2 Tax=Burkholderia reimsis TaxID=2234132 RepID=A0A365QUS2_9BURK|nr:protein Mom [Burkholderia reimsis]